MGAYYKMEILSWGHIVLFWVCTIFGAQVAYVYKKDDKATLAGWILCIFLICVAGLRQNYIDTRTYRSIFERLDVNGTLNIDYLLHSDIKDAGFILLTALIKLMCSNSQFYIFFISAITVGLLYWKIYKCVPDIRVGIFLLIMTGCYLDSMNGIRQMLVASILFFTIPDLIIKRKFVTYCILVLICSTIHASAMVFIPLYFVADKKPWSIYTVLLTIFMLVSFIFFNTGIGAALAQLLESTQYGSDYASLFLKGNTSTNWIRLPVAIAPIILAYLNRDEQADFPYYNIMFNMSLINAGCWLFSQRVVWFYRLASYFQPFMIIHLCYELYRANNRRKDMQIQYCALTLYALYHIYGIYTMSYYLFVGYLNR